MLLNPYGFYYKFVHATQKEYINKYIKQITVIHNMFYSVLEDGNQRITIFISEMNSSLVFVIKFVYHLD